MNDTHIITATEASRSFSDMLNRVAYNGESFVIKKGSRVMARIMPITVESEPAQETVASAHIPEISQEIEEAQLEGLSPDDAEYFKTVLQQIRKIPEPA